MNDDMNVTAGDEEIRDEDTVKKQLLDEGVEIEGEAIVPEEDEVEEDEEVADADENM